MDAAADDAHRAALIAASLPTVRQELSATLTYRETTTAACDALLAALVAAFDSATDNARRGVLLSAVRPTVASAGNTTAVVN